MLQTPKILCIETSSDACSVALSCGETTVEHYEIAPCKHSQLILPMIRKLLADVGFSLSQLDAFAFGCGPGSFTGIRLAASIAQGLALGLELPVMPISTLNVMAQGVYEEYKSPNVLVGLDAKMGGIYWGVYGLDVSGLMQPLAADSLFQPEQISVFAGENWFGVGNAWDIYKDLLLQNYKVTGIEANFYPHAKHIMPIAKRNFSQGKMVGADQALPIYLREQVVNV